MDSFLVMVSETLWTELSSEEIDTAFKVLHGKMSKIAPEPHAIGAEKVPTWGFDYAAHSLRGFLELDAGPKGEHVVTLFAAEDEELMAKPIGERLGRPGLRQILWLRTVN
ncbi:MAG: hypothetical protein RBU21_16025 [FCB group bacterium]|jgi:hypothetical protein|nr:hypothetical protein [FCB group bacterium]